MCTPPITKMVDSTMNLISRTHHSCEMREYVFMVFREYIIIITYQEAMAQAQISIINTTLIFHFLQPIIILAN